MDTDSLYSEWGSLLNTIEGVENMSFDEKLDIVLKINLEFLDPHNFDYIKEYYEQRHCDSVHKFELETVGAKGVWLDVKKKYCQLIKYKDGKYYDYEDMPLKIKGLETAKSSTPSIARDMLKKLFRYFLELENDSNTIWKLNLKMQEMYKEWYNQKVEDICENVKCNNYAKSVIEDTDRIVLKSGAPSNVKALVNYNYHKNKYHLEGEQLYSGKIKIYSIKSSHVVPYYKSKDDCESIDTINVFAFKNGDYHDWMEKYCPIDRGEMFTKHVLEPFNRMIVPSGYPKLTIDGSIQLSLF